MESEKVKEIKKAWTRCGDGVHLRCQKCPYIEKGCEIQLIKDTLTLINELESENERLRKERDKYIVENKDIEESNTYANKFLEKYEEENQQLKNRIAELEKEKTEQLKQFAERLIEKKVKLGDRFNIYDIDETLKEFIND